MLLSCLAIRSEDQSGASLPSQVVFWAPKPSTSLRFTINAASPVTPGNGCCAPEALNSFCQQYLPFSINLNISLLLTVQVVAIVSLRIFLLLSCSLCLGIVCGDSGGFKWSDLPNCAVSRSLVPLTLPPQYQCLDSKLCLTTPSANLL